MKAPRFTIRSLLILVALVALVIEANMLWSRSQRYRAKAVFHASQERQLAREAAKYIKAANSLVKRADAEVAKAIEVIGQTKAKIEENEIYAKAHAGSKIDSEYAERSREIYNASLKLDNLQLEMCKLNQKSNTQTANWGRDYAKGETRLAQYHASLACKYLRAASRPWFGVAADPPAPSTDR
jgi:hypothetical protein